MPSNTMAKGMVLVLVALVSVIIGLCFIIGVAHGADNSDVVRSYDTSMQIAAYVPTIYGFEEF